MSDMETTNSLRVISLVLNTGSRLLRAIFMKQIPAGDRIDVFLRNKRPDLDKLKKYGVLTPPQYDLVTDPSPDVLKFDVTLLVALLRSICNISPPTKGWKQDPPDTTDLSLAADLLRFKGFRNRIAHSPAARLATADFEAKWQEVATILQRLAAHANVTENIDALKTMPLDPTTNWYLCLQEQLSSIQEQNTEQAEAVRLRDANVDTRLSAIHNRIAELGMEMQGVKTNTAGLSEKITEQEPNLSTIHGGVAKLEQEMHGVKAITTGLYDQIAEQAPSLSAINDMVAELGQEMKGVKANTTGLSEQWSMSGSQGEEILAVVNRIQAGQTHIQEDLTRVLAVDEKQAQVPNLLNTEVPGTSSGRTEQSSSAARLCDDVSVQSPSDKKTCDINALRVLAAGQILVADKNNESNIEQADAVRLRDANVETSLSAIHDMVADLRLEMQGLKANTTGISEQITEQSTSLSAIQYRVDELGQDMQGVKNNTTGLSEQIDEQSTAIHDMVAELEQDIQGVKANTTGLSEQPKPKKPPPPTAAPAPKQAPKLPDKAPVADQKPEIKEEKPVNQAPSIPTKKPVHASHPPPPIGKKPHKPAEPPKPADTSHTTKTTEEEKDKPPEEKPVNQAPSIPTKKPVHASHPPPPIGKKPHKPAEPPKPADTSHTTKTTEEEKDKPPEEKPVNQAPSIPTKKPVHASHPPPPIGKKPHKPAEPPKPADTSHTTKTTEEEKDKPPEEKPVNQAPSIPTKKPVHASHPPPPISKKPHKPAEPPKPADTSHTTKNTEEEKHKPPEEKESAPLPPVEKEVVRFSYAAENEDELTLEEGQQITVLDKDLGGWWEGEIGGKIGVFPDNFVELVKEEPKPPPPTAAPAPKQAPKLPDKAPVADQKPEIKEEKPVNQAPSIPTKKPVHASHSPPPIGKKPHKPAEPPKPADTSHTTKTTEEEKHKPPVLTMEVPGTMLTASGRTEQSSSTVRPCDDVNVQSPSDKNDCLIIALQVLADGRVLLTDFSNNAVKLLSGDGRLVSELSLQSHPYDMALVRGDEAVVAMPNEKKIVIIFITDRLTSRRTINTDVACCTIAVSGDKFITGSGGTGEIVMRDMDGRRIRTIWTSASGWIWSVNINPDNDRLYVTDDADTVTCVTLAGDVLGQYKVGNLESPRGMAIHPDGTIYVCVYWSNNIHHITAGCTAISIIIGNGEVKMPHVVGIDSRASKLYVSEWGENKLKVFKLID